MRPSPVVHDGGAELLVLHASGDVDDQVADADDLAVDTYRVIAGQPMKGPSGCSALGPLTSRLTTAVPDSARW